MVSKQLLLVLPFMALFFLQLSATSLARVEKMKKIDEERGGAAAQVNKFSHGGNPVVSGGKGGSHVPSGGGGVTPLYAAAGAGNNNHHPHRGGGNRERSGAGLETLAIITFACFLILLCIF
ncbi:hypothetical protein AAHA92_21303 [Salvia divinorum]|uniref:Glycine-rich protein n=1 Tax=Salvia divinorum TaxID=28513 RepID=A0ABD1GK13_SALDI